MTIEAYAFARGGISRVDVWAIPATDAWGPAWQVRIGVHALGCYTERPATLPDLTEQEALRTLRGLSGEVDPGGATFTLHLAPEGAAGP